MIHRAMAIKGGDEERRLFERWLRTGERFVVVPRDGSEARKFNPWHDPRNGQFTFAPGNGAVATTQGSFSNAVFRPGEGGAAAVAANLRINPRTRIGGNGGPPLNDPVMLEHVFPGLRNAPGGVIIAVADNIVDLIGPASGMTFKLTEEYSKSLIAQIRALDPAYRFDSLGPPVTLEGQSRQISNLRLDRAAAFYRKRGELRPLQVETLRVLQVRTDSAYDEGVALYNAGRLNVRLSREEAIGNYIDLAARKQLRKIYDTQGIAYRATGSVRVVGREYDTSGSDLTYRIPDARVGRIAFDVSLTRKTLATPQIRGFFNSDFRPATVIMIRPSQLGPQSTYAIIRPGE